MEASRGKFERWTVSVKQCARVLSFCCSSRRGDEPDMQHGRQTSYSIIGDETNSARQRTEVVEGGSSSSSRDNGHVGPGLMRCGMSGR